MADNKMTTGDDLVVGQTLGMVKNAATLLEFAADALKQLGDKYSDTLDVTYLRTARNDAYVAMINARSAITAFQAMYRARQ